jgi:hypothetical protein
MTRRPLSLVSVAFLATWIAGVSPAAADQRFIVRTADAVDGIQTVGAVCALVGCTVRYGLDGGLNHLFLVTTIDGLDPQTFIQTLLSQPGITNAEIDQLVRTLGQSSPAAPSALYDREPVAFYGSSVWHGYLQQPAAQLVRLGDARTSSGLTGLNVTVAVIDTGADLIHPVLAPVLLGGYDFTRDLEGGSERRDVEQECGVDQQCTTDPSTTPVVEAEPALVNQSTMAVVDQSTMAVVDDPSRAAFGHGTMVAGVIHLVAPEARILPLKAFRPDGTGYSSDVLRAIYYAVHNGAKVLNMSFSFPAPSAELADALGYATAHGLLAVASAGNTGQHGPVYPGALPRVIGVASSTNADLVSMFSNYGEEFFWIAAPGEAIVSTYPFETYAAAWGTSFSAPFAAGTAALLAQITPAIDQGQALEAVGKAVPMAGVARGRLDVGCAVLSRTQPQLSCIPSMTWSDPADIVYGTPLSPVQLNATASVAGTFTYTPAVGTVLPAGSGQTLHVAFTPTDTATYTSARASVAINVLKATPTITWSTPADLVYGTALDAAQLNATASVPGTLAYTPPAGTVLNAGSGQPLAVTFTPTDTANYTAASASVSINVKVTPTITWTTPADLVYGTALDAAQLTATASVPGTFTYTPAAGTVLSAGSGQILRVVFTPTDTATYTGATASVAITVSKGATAITWTTPADLVYGTALGAAQLTATASVPGTFAYTPSAGTVLNAGAGQPLAVTFTPTDTVNYTGASASVSINVLQATPTITWSTPADIVYGTALGATQLTATASVPGTFAYTPPAGTVLNAGSGQPLAVTFTPTDTANYTGASASVSINVKVTPTITWTTPADLVYGTALDAAQLNATASVSGTFAYTPPAGTVLNAGAGQTLAVTFTPTDTATYTGASASVAITVSKDTTAITWATPADLVYGTALGAAQLTATASVPGTFAYTPAAGTVLNAGSGQPLRVEFTPTDTANYAGATASVAITVSKATPTLAWTTPADLVYGTALDAAQLTATASVPGTFAYTPAAGTVLNAGSGQPLRVAFTPADTVNYSGAAADVQINVLKATPTITWHNPADIVEGTALSDVQLNATASVPGTFAYSATAGTVLTVGSGQTLSATFTPADPANYSGATASVVITVTPNTPAEANLQEPASEPRS